MKLFLPHRMFSHLILPPLVLLIFSQASRGADDAVAEYFPWIEAEAKRQAATAITNPDAGGSTTAADTGRLPLGLQTQQDFEKALREQFAGTYAFYQRLNDAGKEQIFQAYRQNNRVSVIREQTLRLLAVGGP